MTLSTRNIHERFRRHGLRITRQRAAIYAALVATASHPTADDLFQMVKPRHPGLSRNTVYYTLGMLRQAGLVREVNVGHEVARFDGNVDPHHHLICVGCGTIVDLMDETLNRLSPSGGQAKGFQVLGHRVEFHGYCSRCRMKPAKASTVGGQSEVDGLLQGRA